MTLPKLTPPSDASPRPYFSMRDELMSTERHHTQWTPSTKLRNQAISFVSAGAIQPLDEPVKEEGILAETVEEQLESDLAGPEDAMAGMTIEPSAEATGPEDDVSAVEIDEVDIDMTETVVATVSEELNKADQKMEVPEAATAEDIPAAEEPLPFVVDVVGDRSLAPPENTIFATRSSSPTPSNSSDEVIMFRGRNGVTVRDDPAQASHATKSIPPVSKTASKPVPKTSHVTDTLLSALGGSSEPSQASTAPASAPLTVSAEGTWASRPPRWNQKEEAKHWKHADREVSDRREQFALVEVKPASRKGKNARKKQNRQLRLEEDLEEELLQDYIDNMDEEEKAMLAKMSKLDAKSGTDSAWESASSDDDEEEEGEEEGETEFILDAADDSDDPDPMSSEYGSDDEDRETGDDSDLESDLEYTERERWEDEEDLRQRRQDALTDEEIARMLAKQESLGMGGDELLIFDEGFGDVDRARDGLEDYSFAQPKKNKSGTRRRGGRKSDNFPDASLMADVLEANPYGGFDVMDFERPSLKRKSKGRKSAGALPEELALLSDEELIGELQSAWMNDRSKKKQKKAEREELRALGLLGGKGKKNKFTKPDLHQRYQEGITLSQIKIELEEFLDNEDWQTKNFPPMLKDDRKILHQIAEHFNLKSKSVGAGKNRAPVLIKTNRTIEFSEERFSLVYGYVQKGFFPNSRMNGKKGRGANATAQQSKLNRLQRGKGGTGAAGGYRNGEVVGATAPEIGESNFGRKLMERMGWQKGMALGKEGSLGLLTPVAAVVKSGKAGLG